MNSHLTEQNDFFVVEGLTKAFHGKPVLKGTTFTIPRGKTTVILGGSGAGKSVLLKHLNGLFTPDAGTVFVDGESLAGKHESELVPIRRKIGILFQNGALFDSMSVAENVAFPLKEQSKLPHSEIASRVSETLEHVGLADAAETMPGDLSGGMRKRAGLARAIITHPEAMLYDEPTAGLDPILATTIAKLITRLKEELSLTSVVVTHHLGLVRTVADQVIFLSEGSVIFQGSVDEFNASRLPILLEYRGADESLAEN
ncbi:MAG: ATP-binding cassette domain-containing protein [Verrucomicrobiales bacterium]|nr:ATP-binding cassette domain-containing protein [Verrucomicrobiales bacterium]